jgi:hypothetical protein
LVVFVIFEYSNTKTHIKKLLLIFLIACTFGVTKSQFSYNWHQSEDFGGYNLGRLVETFYDATTEKQYVYTVAESFDPHRFIVIQHDEDGVFQWSTELPVDGYALETARNMEKAFCLSDGTLLVAGDWKNIASDRKEIFMASFSKDGDLNWVNSYHAAGKNGYFDGFVVSDDETTVSIVGNYLLYPIDAAFDYGIAFFRVNILDGVTEASNVIAIGNKWGQTTTVNGSDAGIYLGGFIQRNPTRQDAFIIKVNTSGEEQWFRTFGGYYPIVNWMQVHPDGRLVAGIKKDTQFYQVLYLNPEDGSTHTSTNKDYSDIVSYFTKAQAVMDSGGNITVALQKTSYELVGGSYSYVSGVMVERIDAEGNYTGTYNISDERLDTIKRSKTGGENVYLMAASYSAPLSDSVSAVYEIVPDASIHRFRLKDFANGQGQQDFTTYDGSLVFTTGTLLSEDDGSYATTTVCLGNTVMRMSAPDNVVEVQVFPQPFDAGFTFYAGEANGLVQVYDNSGRHVQTIAYQGAPLQVATENWTSGNYLLRFTSDSATVTTALIKL